MIIKNAPEVIKVDNGKEFHLPEFKRLIEMLGIKVEYGIPGRAQDRRRRR